MIRNKGEGHIHMADSELPYERTLSNAARSGMVLHREHIYGSGPPATAPSPEALSLIAARAGSPLLDVGCGIGVYVAALQQSGIDARGLEVNPDHVKMALRLGRDVSFYDGDRIPSDDGSYDSVIAIEVLEHIPSWERTLHEMLRVARRRVLLSMPNIGVIPAMSRHLVVPWHLLESTHVNFFTPEILQCYLARVEGVHAEVLTYGAFRINGEVFHNHVFTSITKLNDRPGAANHS